MRVNVKMQICENPECTNQHPEFQGLDAHGVYVDRGWWLLAGGGGFGKVYACSWECLGPACKAAADEAYDKGKSRKGWS